MVLSTKLDNETILRINLFEDVTGTDVKDCIIDEDKDKITFIVAEGQAGLAIGKSGSNINKLEDKLNRKIEVLGYSKDPIKFIKNIFRPIEVKNAYLSETSDGDKIANVDIGGGKRGMIGAKKRTARKLVKKYFDVGKIKFK